MKPNTTNSTKGQKFPAELLTEDEVEAVGRVVAPARGPRVGGGVAEAAAPGHDTGVAGNPVRDAIDFRALQSAR